MVRNELHVSDPRDGIRSGNVYIHPHNRKPSCQMDSTSYRFMIIYVQVGIGLGGVLDWRAIRSRKVLIRKS